MAAKTGSPGISSLDPPGPPAWLTSGHRRSRALAAVILMGMAWTLPFLQPYHPLPVTAFYGEWLALSLGLAAAFAALLVSGGTKGFSVPGVAVGLIALAVLFLIHGGLGRALYPGDALNAARYLLWAALLAVLGAAVRRDLGARTVTAILACALLIGGLATAAAALVQHYRWDTPFNFLIAPKIGAAVYGNLGHYGHFASYMSLAVASVLYLYGRGALHVLLSLACVTVFLLVLTLSGARSAWLYLIVITLLAWAWHRRLKTVESARLFNLALLLLPAFVLAQWAVLLPFMRTAEHLVTAGERLFELPTGTGPRLWLARVAWETFLASPLFGAGPGQFAWHYFEASALGDGPFYGLHRHAHNIVLHLLAETGITGAGAVIGVVFLWLRNTRLAAVDLHQWWLLVLLGVIGVHSLLENPLWYASFLGIATFLLGMGETRFLEVRPRVMAVITTVAVVLGGYALVTSVLRYRDYEQALYASSAMTPEARDTIISEQLRRNRGDLVLAPYAELILARSFALSEQGLGEKLRLNSRVTRFAPTGNVVFRQAVLLALGDDQAGAEAQFSRVARVYPRSLPQFIEQLRELAVHYPGKLGPLLKLALAEQARLLPSPQSP